MVVWFLGDRSTISTAAVVPGTNAAPRRTLLPANVVLKHWRCCQVLHVHECIQYLQHRTCPHPHGRVIRMCTKINVRSAALRVSHVRKFYLLTAFITLALHPVPVVMFTCWETVRGLAACVPSGQMRHLRTDWEALVSELQGRWSSSLKASVQYFPRL